MTIQSDKDKSSFSDVWLDREEVEIQMWGQTWPDRRC